MKNIFAFIILVLGAVGFSDVQAQDRLMLIEGCASARIFTISEHCSEPPL